MKPGGYSSGFKDYKNLAKNIFFTSKKNPTTYS